VVDWTYADVDDGCFLIPRPSSTTTYTLGYRPYSRALSEGNELVVRSSTGELPHYSASFSVTSTGGETVDLELPNDVLPRMYAVYAYAIEERFRAQYQNRVLNVWNGNSGPLSCGANCAGRTSDGEHHIHISNDSSNERKFLMIHEYGHANLSGAALETGSSLGGNDCSLNGSTHGMRGVEHASCAAMEGWAHFVAAEVFNDGSVSSEFAYWSGEEFDIDNGSGTCTSASDDRWPLRFAIVCGNETNIPARGTELDWLRALWDFQYDSGSMPNNDDMQNMFLDTGGWSQSNIYDQVEAALPSGFVSRWRTAADRNGVCVLGSSC